MAALARAGQLDQKLSKQRILIGMLALYAVMLQAFIVSALPVAVSIPLAASSVSRMSAPQIRQKMTSIAIMACVASWLARLLASLPP